MVEEIRTQLRLTASDNRKELKCEFLDSKLRECVDLDNFQMFNLKSSEIANQSILNCINSMILTCVGKKKLNLNFSLIDVNITLTQDSKNQWIIESAMLNLDTHFDNKEFLEQLKNCLKFFNVTCIDLNSIKFNVSFSETNEALKHYKSELFKLKAELEVVLGKELNL